MILHVIRQVPFSIRELHFKANALDSQPFLKKGCWSIFGTLWCAKIVAFMSSASSDAIKTAINMSRGFKVMDENHEKITLAKAK